MDFTWLHSGKQPLGSSSDGVAKSGSLKRLLIHREDNDKAMEDDETCMTRF